MEVPSCGHATIAAHYVRAREAGLPSGTVEVTVELDPASGTPVRVHVAGHAVIVFRGELTLA